MSARYDRVMRSIREGRPLLMDGATGTEVERRGVPKLEHAWNGGGALSHPDIVQEIHEDYIRCGARIIIFEHLRYPPQCAGGCGGCRSV